MLLTHSAPYQLCLSLCFVCNQVIIDYLKIDVDYDEWESLETMLADQTLARVKQLGIEIHTSRYRTKMKPSRHYTFWNYWVILKQLEDLGFLRWRSHFNRWGFSWSRFLRSFFTFCYEMVYINTNFLPNKRSSVLLIPTNVTVQDIKF